MSKLGAILLGAWVSVTTYLLIMAIYDFHTFWGMPIVKSLRHISWGG